MWVPKFGIVESEWDLSVRVWGWCGKDGKGAQWDEKVKGIRTRI